ncbi:MAG TPA: tRNA (N6-isopentenyl adenosine(37)-C2)-methylthiotransferase MiaB [Candidatus Eisenbacteria bacterium]|nr:tRNA (N6-isopentenyl adenosine(37)-C2)-methylthiotransferase MiaB [Candidatus Eisenbacteria bacterium]
MSRAKYHLITYGCQMNKSDSERVATVLDRMGMDETEREGEADLILINSCSVRQTAEDRIFGKMRDFAALKEKNPKLVVGVTGCLPGRDRDGKIRAKMPAADLYFPIKDLPQLPRWMAELNPEFANEGDVEEDYLAVKPRYAREKQAYVSIQTGCNKFCTYCVVPFSRGLEKNRPALDILREVRERTERGTVEITLLGQTVNSYRAPDRGTFSAANPYKDDFAALLWEVNQVPGVERIHYTAPHPLHMTDEVIDALTLPKHVHYLHLPVQSGNDEVLRRMNRRYTREKFLEVIRKVRAKRPEIGLGTDIIVGFCGETEEQFEDTVSMYKEADFDVSYTAMYSPRSGTAAYKAFKDDVPRLEKKRRWLKLQGVMEETVLRKNQAYLGKTVEVLVDAWDHGVASGQSREMKLTRFNCSEDLRGKTVRVTVKKVFEWMLSGELTAPMV